MAPAKVNLPKLSMRHMARLTPKSIRDRATRTCTVRVKAVKVDMNDVGAYKMVQTGTICRNRVHEQTIMMYHRTRLPDTLAELRRLNKTIPTDPGLWNAKAWVSCECEWFKYSCEVALDRFNCTDVIHSNGAWSIFTNPRGVPWLCKHVYAASPVAIQTKRARDVEFSRLTHPPHPGRPPNILRELMDKKKLTPTEEEVSEALEGVEDFF